MTPDKTIILDWGTSRFRAYLVEISSGRLIDEVPEGLGMGALKRDEFPGYCHDRVSHWCRERGRVPIYMSGMVGAAQGWLTAPQPPAPVGIADLAALVVPADGVDDAWIVPGVRSHKAGGGTEVMRGEEVQIFGALELEKLSSARLCLPGTHAKWATVRGGILMDFDTAMTGELYQAVLGNTVVGKLGDMSAAFDRSAFEQGLATASAPGGVLHHLFGARGRHLYGELTRSEVPSFVSGVLIGEEVSGMAAIETLPGAVLLVCSDELRTPYEIALSFHGVEPIWVGAKPATLAGVLSIVRLRECGAGAGPLPEALDIDDSSGETETGRAL